MPAFIPDSGDIVWMHFDPQIGHEQAGHRPALVLSPSSYNGQRGMMVCCPLSSKIKGYVFEVVVTTTPPSVILADQVENVDWRARSATFKGKVSVSVLAEVQGKIRALLRL